MAATKAINLTSEALTQASRVLEDSAGRRDLITACYRHDLRPYQVLTMTRFDPVLSIHHLNRSSPSPALFGFSRQRRVLKVLFRPGYQGKTSGDGFAADCVHRQFFSINR